MKRQLFIWCLCTLVTLVGCMHVNAQKEKGFTPFVLGKIGYDYQAIGGNNVSLNNSAFTLKFTCFY